MDKRPSSSQKDSRTAENAPEQNAGASKTTCTRRADNSPVAVRTVTIVGDVEEPASAAECALRHAQGALQCRCRQTGRRGVTPHRHGPEPAKTADDIVISDPPVETALTRLALRRSDVIPIVLTGSPNDIGVSSEVRALGAETSILKPAVRTALVVSQSVSPTPLEADINEPGAS